MFGLFSLLIPLMIVGGIVAVVVVSVQRGREKDAAQAVPVSPKDVFVYLLSTVTLYISAAGVLTLIWGLAEYWFPDPFRSSFSSGLGGGGVRVGVSMAIVAFPIFIFLARLVHKKIRSGEINPGSTLRTGFIYFNLFVISVTTLVTMMVTVGTFLGGDLTPRFFVRAGGVLLIVGLVYLYYRNELDSAHSGGKQPEVSL